MEGDELGTASGTSAVESAGFGCRNPRARGEREDIREVEVSELDK
jgi:hypothetical protein